MESTQTSAVEFFVGMVNVSRQHTKKSGSQDPNLAPQTQDPYVGPQGRTLSWKKVGHCFISKRHQNLSTLKCYFLNRNIANNKQCKGREQYFENKTDAMLSTHSEKKFIWQKEKNSVTEKKELGE